MTRRIKKQSGCLFIVSAPSGAGKTTLCNAAIKRFPNLTYSISHTTRPPRKGERHGVDYFFIDRLAFEQKVKQKFWAEWAQVHHHYYGTSADFLNDRLASGRDILLDLDVQGTRQMIRRYPDCVTVFILPPSLDVLKTRLEARATDEPAVIARRLETAKQEMAQSALYRYVLVNDQLDIALNRFFEIIRSHGSVDPVPGG